jgi:hypothetical protein
MVQLLHENCQQPTVDADGCLPSKSVYLVHAPEEDLFWALDYLHDRLKLWGEKRTLYKWRTFVAESLQKCVLVSRSFVCHLHFSGRDLPPSALDDNVASTRAVLTYLFTIMETGRKDDMVQQVFQLLCRICNRVCETFCHDSPGYKMDLMLDDDSRLEVCAQSGLVGGMQDFVSAKHRTAWQAWAKLWADMYSAGLLSVDVVGVPPLLPLKDVLHFAFAAARFQRKQQGKAWNHESPSGAALILLQRGIINFLSQGLFLYVIGQYQCEHDVYNKSRSFQTERGKRQGCNVCGCNLGFVGACRFDRCISQRGA